jgi:hypothetical protein
VGDVAYRVVAGNLVLDHSTIAELRVRHEDALADLLTGVLGLCGRAGLVSVGVVAIDGAKVAANASRETNRSYGQIAREILAEAAETDRREDELYGESRGDELPERLRTSAGRRAALREAREKLEREAGREARPDGGEPGGAGVEIERDPERFVTRSHGRRAWFREARRGLDGQREQAARPIARSRLERLGESARRLEEELAVERLANAAYEAWRRRGRRRGRPAADGARHDQALPPAGPAGGDDQHDRS